ncbi:catechol 2,3-dioxygenase-like lactoylglutathione lyase family enzyme [Melghirimyces profundicolus]|uniref:Catechol 2,3-dioxygenase-like lactoylglutathione lyase family enzyme n=1 Tax=Melghirimyces profundicolus TaxID=1242148 RepID=A0A2T6BQS7_9BACL|nr:ArsI/CadI family heavy metal resistance metalloenzyme [Melghirimyces profundicolus]PTX58327.1 catechol 2,3-dioxygenase-like lactoylglutathione lyase family enzyme [Melghirimyces profundicolus]
MALKPHVAINVKDLKMSVPFYRHLFGEEPIKVRHGYAKFALNEPVLNITLNEGGQVTGGFNHLGIQVGSSEELLAAKERLKGAGLAFFDEMDTACCYARQDKIWVTSPDGHRWEVFLVKGDAESFGTSPVTSGADNRCCPHRQG